MKLQLKLMLAGAISISLGLGGMGYFVAQKSSDNLSNQILKQLDGHLLLSQSIVSKAQNDQKIITKIVSQNRSIKKALHLLESRGTNTILNDLVNVYPYLNYIAIAEPDGTIFAASTVDSNGRKIAGENLLLENISQNPLFSAYTPRHISTGVPGIDPYLSRIGLEKGVAQWFSTEVTKRGENIGWVVLSIDWQSKYDDLLNDIKNFLVESDSSILHVVLTNQSGQVVAQNIGSGISHLDEYDNAKQGNSIVSRIEQLKFGPKTFNLQIAADQRTLYAPIKETTSAVILISCIGALILAFILSQVLRRTVLSRVAALHDGAKIFSKGNLNHRIKNLGKDEIGDLGSAYNQMAENLTNITASKQELDKEIEERKLANEKVNIALHKLRAYQNAIDNHSIVAMLDTDGIIIEANQLACDISGYTSKELIGQAHGFLNSDKHPESFWSDQWDTISRGKVWTGEVCHKAKDGSFYWTSTSISPLTNYKGEITSFCIVRTNITSLEEARSIAEQANKAKSEFLATMSHEIRTPMNGVIGMLGLLKRSDLKDQDRHYADIAQSSAESLLALINDILDFSKIEAGKLDLESVDFDLHQLVQGLSKEMAFRVNQKNLQFELHIDDSAPQFIQSDPNRLRQILVNLIGNAIKFTQSGKVSLSVKVNKPVSSGIDESVLVAFAIIDTGIGIPEDKLSELFMAFSQVDSSTTRKYGGSGLGLSIVRQLSDLMGGSVSVTSKVNEGSCFTFTIKANISESSRIITLPLAKNKAQAEDINSAAIKENNDEAKILLVEDNRVNQLVAQEILKELGFTSEVANNGEEAIKLLCASTKQNPYKLVLMDCQMPVMDGYEATQQIRTGGQVPDPSIAIIAMTANAMEGDKEKCLDAGMDDYLAKPFQPEQLQDVLHRWLKQA